VCRLQSVGETESEAFKYQTAATNIATAPGCSRGRKGYVQGHAEGIERLRITSSADREVIKNKYPYI